MTDDALDAARWRAAREQPNRFWVLYSRSPELDKHFDRMRSDKNIDHGALADRAADRLRGVTANG